MKISETINSAAGNMARPTKFNVLLFPPLGFTDGYADRGFDVMCKTAGVPETTMEPIEMTFKGHTLKVPGRVNQQQEITVTFYLDEFHKLRRTFYDWINAIDDRGYGIKSERAVALYNEIQNNKLGAYGGMILKVRDFAESLNEPMNYVFENIYPTNVGGAEFNSAGTNEVMEFTVTFAFTSFRHENSLMDYNAFADSILDSFGGQ